MSATNHQLRERCVHGQDPHHRWPRQWEFRKADGGLVCRYLGWMNCLPDSPSASIALGLVPSGKNRLGEDGSSTPKSNATSCTRGSNNRAVSAFWREAGKLGDVAIERAVRQRWR